MNLGEIIQKYRKKRNMTQNELAEILYVSYQAISQWENGNTKPDIEMLPKLAKALNVTINDLFEYSDKKILDDINDDTLYIVLARGKEIKQTINYDQCNLKDDSITINIENDVNNIVCHFNAKITGDVNGNMSVGNNVICNNVNGNIACGNNITCDNVEGKIACGNNITCDSIEGDVSAGYSISCDEIIGDVKCEGTVYCSNIHR